MRIKLKMEGRGPGKVVIIDATSSSAASLAALACETFSLPAADLFCGFPPRPLATSPPIRDGDLVEVRVPPPCPFSLVRFPVPGDNSCLFHAVGFCLFGGAVGERPPALRAEVAREVLANSDFWNEAVLARPPRDYADYICRQNTWGGATELLILAKLHGGEICAVEVRSGVVYHFGEGAEKRLFLIYTGCHFDALVVGTGAVAGDRLVPAAEPRFKESALAVAAAAKAAREFVDVGALQLKCHDCGLGVTGGEDAMRHAKETQHVQFVEWKS